MVLNIWRINLMGSFILILLFTACGGLVNKYVLESPHGMEGTYRNKVNLHAPTKEREGGYVYFPLELFKKAKEFGFDAFAITDLPHAGGIVEDPGLEGILHISGIEYGGQPHLIGIGIDRITHSTDKLGQIGHIKNQGGLAYIPHPYWKSTMRICWIPYTDWRELRYLIVWLLALRFIIKRNPGSYPITKN